jgi:hypothetical protein
MGGWGLQSREVRRVLLMIWRQNKDILGVVRCVGVICRFENHGVSLGGALAPVAKDGKLELTELPAEAASAAVRECWPC